MAEVRTTVNSGVWYAIGGVLLAASFFVRIISYPVITSDYTYFVAKWFDALASHPGLTAFSYPFADYAPLYLYMLKVLTLIPVSSLYSAKTLSLLFDIAIAVLACLILRKAAPERWRGGRALFAFALMLSIPTLVLNSSLWGQSDALYAAPILAAVYAMAADLRADGQSRILGFCAAFAAGVAFAIKVQAIFFLPVLAGYLAWRRDLKQLLWVPGVFALSLVPALIGGGSAAYWALIYAKQAGEYTGLTINAPSLFAFAPSGADSVPLFWAGIALAAAAAVAAFAFARRAAALRSPGLLLLAGALSVALMPFFLPRMHERYFYLADVFAVLFALYRPRFWYVPLLAVSASLLSYFHYLSAAVPALAPLVVDLRVPAALMALALAGLVLPLAASRMFRRSIYPARRFLRGGVEARQQ